MKTKRKDKEINIDLNNSLDILLKILDDIRTSQETTENKIDFMLCDKKKKLNNWR